MVLEQINVALAITANGREIGEVGDFGDEIINRRHSTPILPILC